MTTEIETQTGEKTAAAHLRQALEADNSEEKNFHIRQAMQLLVAESV